MGGGAVGTTCRDAAPRGRDFEAPVLHVKGNSTAVRASECFVAKSTFFFFALTLHNRLHAKDVFVSHPNAAK